MSKNILVTGGAGYIGSQTVRALIKSGYNVTIVDNLSTGFKQLVHPDAKLYEISVLETQRMEQILRDEQISGIIHFAAKIIVPESIIQPLMYYHNNTMGVESTLQAAKSSGVRNIVFSSTAAVYGTVSSSLITEDFPTKPINPYGHSKLMSEQIIKDCEKDFGLKSVILRYFNVAGASEDLSFGQISKVSTHLIKIASETACGKRPFMNITGTDYNTPDGTGIRDYIHVQDLADIHVLAMNYLHSGGESTVLNCGYGKGFSVKEVITTFKKVSGIDFKVIEAARRPGDGDSLVGDNKKLKETLKWNAKYENLELICKSAYEWEKKLNN